MADTIRRDVEITARLLETGKYLCVATVRHNATLEEVRRILDQKLATNPAFPFARVDRLCTRQRDKYPDFTLVWNMTAQFYAGQDGTWAVYVTGADKRILRWNKHEVLKWVDGCLERRFA
jgi:hypothetical protein